MIGSTSQIDTAKLSCQFIQWLKLHNFQYDSIQLSGIFTLGGGQQFLNHLAAMDSTAVLSDQAGATEKTFLDLPVSQPTVVTG